MTLTIEKLSKLNMSKNEFETYVRKWDLKTIPYSMYVPHPFEHTDEKIVIQESTNNTKVCFSLDDGGYVAIGWDIIYYHSYNNILHRLDGPAYIFDNIHKLQPKIQEFYIHGNYCTEENFWKHPLVVKNTFKKILEI